MTLSAGFFSLSCQCKKEKADTKQEHNGLSHMTSDPTIANVGTYMNMNMNMTT